MLRCVGLVRTDVSEERFASIRVIVFLCSVRRLVVTANVLSSPILVTLMVEAIHASETSVLTTVTLLTIPEDGLLLSHRREHLKSLIALTGWAL
jgi:hypothetical protein